ncbi:hypothetical protein CEXT_182091 [Caerostris extrusa]|uniref:Uncharacterized protein n=1 Tax=Caerostris extrusa TaxID=172846 RepID=A0AAV4Y3B9_CAEEX|nr:hypothetical protein CEXT_182091 [Caerostris extrusa]
MKFSRKELYAEQFIYSSHTGELRAIPQRKIHRRKNRTFFTGVFQHVTLEVVISNIPFRAFIAGICFFASVAKADVFTHIATVSKTFTAFRTRIWFFPVWVRMRMTSLSLRVNALSQKLPAYCFSTL